MKTYTLLGHIFELEHRAHLFLTHYIKRIDDYATEHTISSEIVEDLKYNIIEKLYASQTPISEQYVMTVASNLGEPEDIFGSGEEQTQQAPKNLMEEWFGTNKPMLRGVCYWIAKSFSLPIIVVRIVML